MTRLSNLDIPANCPHCDHPLPSTIPIQENAMRGSFTVCAKCTQIIELPLKDKRPNLRASTLEEAMKCVMHDRNRDCGDPEDNFATIGEFWTTYLQAAGVLPKDKKIVHHQVGIMMVLFKAARQAVSPHKGDHYVDGAGYNACARDCAKAK